jgi:hypothetical protein
MAGHELTGRLAREQRTVDAMVAIFCRDLHGSSPASCADCGGLGTYARERLVHCPFGAGKPTCANCAVHCYQRDMRERVRTVMRYAGPRMLLRHPVLTLLHRGWDSRGRVTASRLKSRSSF